MNYVVLIILIVVIIVLIIIIVYYATRTISCKKSSDCSDGFKCENNKCVTSSMYKKIIYNGTDSENIFNLEYSFTDYAYSTVNTTDEYIFYLVGPYIYMSKVTSTEIETPRITKAKLSSYSIKQIDASGEILYALATDNSLLYFPLSGSSGLIAATNPLEPVIYTSSVYSMIKDTYNSAILLVTSNGSVVIDPDATGDTALKIQSGIIYANLKRYDGVIIFAE